MVDYVNGLRDIDIVKFRNGLEISIRFSDRNVTEYRPLW